MSTIVLSVDPANMVAGWALFDDVQRDHEKLVSHGCLKGTPAKRRSVKGRLTKSVKIVDAIKISSAEIYQVIQKAHQMGCRVLAIESQYLDMAKSNPKTLTSMVEARMRWQVLAEMLGWEIINIYPASWQSQVIPSARKRERKDFKADSKKFALMYYKVDVTDDVSDAICIGHYAISDRRIKNARLL